MEFLLELFLTALIAVFFSFLIAKLVSVATAGGDSQVSASPNVDQVVSERTTEDVQYRERLQVHKFRSEKRVKFVEQEVDRFLQGSIEVDKFEKLAKSNEVIDAECCGLPSKSGDGDELSMVISGSDVDEFLLNREFGVNLPEDKSGIKHPEEVIDEKKIGADDNLLEGNIKFGMETVAKDVIEESEETRSEESGAQEKGDEKKLEIDSDVDDWEGIERSELENIFVKAAEFMEDKDLTVAGNDVQMELYGLYKIATEGPCREQAPMPLKVAARAKWNAWQRLGNMNPEEAMERYIALVSDNIPTWTEDKFAGDGKPEPLEVATKGVMPSDTSIPLYNHPDYTEQTKNAEGIPSTENNYLTGGPTLESLARE